MFGTCVATQQNRMYSAAKFQHLTIGKHHLHPLLSSSTYIVMTLRQERSVHLANLEDVRRYGMEQFRSDVGNHPLLFSDSYSDRIAKILRPRTSVRHPNQKDIGSFGMLPFLSWARDQSDYLLNWVTCRNEVSNL